MVSHTMDAILEHPAEYLVGKRIGISRNEGKKLEELARKLEKGNWRRADAWSLIISVEAWRQARMAFYAAIAVGVANVVVAIGGLLMTLFR